MRQADARSESYGTNATSERQVTPADEWELVGGSETILLAEDDCAVRSALSLLLEDAGYSVLTAVDGEDALELFRRCHGQIDLLVLDVMMPKLDGTQVLTKVREIAPDARALLCSGYGEEDGVTLPLRAPLIHKPCDATTLLRCIRGELDRVQQD